MLATLPVNRSDLPMEQPDMATASDARTDPELLAAIAEHDRGALEVLYHRHEPWLTMRLARRCSDRTVVDEVVQDTFVTVWRTADRYAGSGEVAAWIWGIGIRRLLQALRPRKPLLERLRRVRVEEAASAEEQVLLGIEHGGLAEALGGLSPELRAVVEATILDGLTTNEAAALLGIPSGTVKSRMMRARREMRKALA